MLQLSTKKISLKSDTEHRKYARFSGLVLFFACLLPQLSGLLSRMLMGTSYSASTTDKCRINLQSILWCVGLHREGVRR